MKFGKEVIDILEYLCEKFGIAVDWTSDNVMPYLQQLSEKYVKYEISTSFAWICLAAVAFFVIAILAIIDYRKHVFYGFMCSWGITICIIATFIVIGCQVFDIIECYTIPEKVIFEYIKSMKGQYR